MGDADMPDYKEMYFKLFRATEKAMEILIDAQRECEEMYINAPTPEIVVFSALESDDE